MERTCESVSSVNAEPEEEDDDQTEYADAGVGDMGTFFVAKVCSRDLMDETRSWSSCHSKKVQTPAD